MRIAVPVKFNQIHPNAVIPEYKTPGAGAVDLVITEIEYEDEDKVTVKYGFSTEVSEHYKIFIAPRSSFTLKGWVMQNTPGIIDSDYRGEWMNKFQAIPVGIKLEPMTGKPLGFIYEDFPYKIGDRICQATVEVNMHMKFKEAQLSETLRGTGGFGSTG